MNRTLIREVGNLPFSIVEIFAKDCGVDWASPDCLMELQAIIIEEIIDKEVDAPNVLSAFNVVRDSVKERWTNWLQESVFDAYDV